MDTKLNSFVLADAGKCIGCRVCEIACASAHTIGPGKTVGCLTEPLLSRLYLVKTAEVTMPVQCHHCDNAPCIKSCPVSCIFLQQGSIRIEEEKCIGCKSCVLACPFGAIELIITQLGENTAASKCDLCHEQLTGPACVANCPQAALQYVDFPAVKKMRQKAAAEAISDIVKNFRIREN